VQTLTKQLLIQDGNTLVLRPMVLNCYVYMQWYCKVLTWDKIKMR